MPCFICDINYVKHLKSWNSNEATRLLPLQRSAPPVRQTSASEVLGNVSKVPACTRTIFLWQGRAYPLRLFAHICAYEGFQPPNMLHNIQYLPFTESLWLPCQRVTTIAASPTATPVYAIIMACCNNIVTQNLGGQCTFVFRWVKTVDTHAARLAQSTIPAVVDAYCLR